MSSPSTSNTTPMNQEAEVRVVDFGGLPPINEASTNLAESPQTPRFSQNQLTEMLLEDLAKPPPSPLPFHLRNLTAPISRPEQRNHTFAHLSLPHAYTAVGGRNHSGIFSSHSVPSGNASVSSHAPTSYAMSARGSVSSRRQSSQGPEIPSSPGKPKRVEKLRKMKSRKITKEMISEIHSIGRSPLSEVTTISPPKIVLTDAQTDQNRIFAQGYIKKWSKLKRRGLDPRVVDFDHDGWVGEWNPAQAKYPAPLPDLELPWEMLLDCVFDRRNLYTDILRAETPRDPITHQFLIYIWCMLLEQVFKQWRSLRSKPARDWELREHLDTLVELQKDEDMDLKPFEPLGNYLSEWAKWRELCRQADEAGEDGEEKFKHRRPVLDKLFPRFLLAYGALGLKEEALNKLKDLMEAKGPKELAVMVNLAWAEAELKKVIEERGGSAFHQYV